MVWYIWRHTNREKTLKIQVLPKRGTVHATCYTSLCCTTTAALDKVQCFALASTYNHTINSTKLNLNTILLNEYITNTTYPKRGETYTQTNDIQLYPESKIMVHDTATVVHDARPYF